MVNFNLNGIQKKLMDKADWIAFLAGAWERYNGDLSAMFKHYTTVNSERGFLLELRRNLTNMDSLKWSLWDSPHLYTTIFKTTTIARLLVEVGLIPPKYKKVIEKAMLGSGLGAITLPGHASHEAPNERNMFNRAVRDANQPNPFLRATI